MALNGEQWEQLNNALVSAFPDRDRLQRMLQFRCDRALARITGEGPLDQAVFDVIEAAEAEGWTGRLIVGARNSNPGNADLASAAAAIGLAIEAPEGRTLEVLITKHNGFVNPTEWRERLGMLEGQVCRIEFDYRGEPARGTGFLVAADIVMTNHHVVAPLLREDVAPGEVSVRFDYKELSDGTTAEEGTVFKLGESDWCVASSPPSAIDRMKDPGASVPSDKELDFALVRLADAPGDKALGKNPEMGAAKRGWIRQLAPALAMGDLVYVLQHPDGGPLSLAGDVVVGLNPTRVRYRTNTLGGSSGSPCFDVNWRLAALHHSGDPRHDEFRRGEYNEGVPMDPVLNFLGDSRSMVFQ